MRVGFLQCAVLDNHSASSSQFIAKDGLISHKVLDDDYRTWIDVRKQYNLKILLMTISDR